MWHTNGMTIYVESEKEFDASVRQLAQMLGWRRYHTYDSRRSEPGFPDLVLVRDRIIFAELKSEKGKVTARQEAWIAALRTAGAEVYVWRPSDMDAIAEVLSRIIQT